MFRYFGALLVLMTWSATALESIGPPFVVRMVAFGLAPLAFNISSDSWNAASLTGSYSFTVPWPEGTQFLSVMDDGFGLGTGGISGIQTVKSSSNSTCINPGITEPSHIFDIYSSFVQCSQVSMNWTEPATSRTRIAGLVPNGVAFQLDAPLTDSKSTTWDLNIEAGTAFVLIYNDGSGNGLASSLLQSLGGSNTKCLASGAYPSATASQTGVAQVTVTGTPVPSNTASSIPTSEPNNSNSRSKLGPILGAVFGALALFSALGLGVWITLRKRRRKRVVPQALELAKGDFDAANTRSNPQSDRNHSSTSPYHPQGAVILPFVLPYNGSHRQEDAPRKRPIRRETVDSSDSSQVYMTGTSVSQSTPGFRGDADDEPMIIRHEDAGIIVPSRTREVIELPPGYDQLHHPLPSTQIPQQEDLQPTPSQKLTGESGVANP
ncbi:alphaherpesvirus glycoprotein E domain protein, putative [Rhizoctonia solani AG-3 Rhs1AP]|uniref:Alphaherpesvirus glycoprotein E domain protein, putative n=2 Tax=Rhizoctonia solani AG-3 TaxID=1086053 RepID=X8JFF3_9AGAM|nr:alphaherpesvirus glycoprotein E domain protein, putative [Rhizoctonia solani AG-3 Rhs1AP]KEP53376.1 putative alphaherpesvirus glycoprotein E domain protein [Rhizoctonia solani 123E]